MDDNQLGKMIKHRRVYVDKSLRALAEETGISFSHLSKIERGEHTPSKEMLKTLAEHLEMSEYDLFVMAGYQIEAENKMWQKILIKIFNKGKLDELKSILGKNFDSNSEFNLETAAVTLRNNFMHNPDISPDIKGLIAEYFINETVTQRFENPYTYSTVSTIVSEVKEELGSDYVKWLELADKLMELGYTPEKVKDIIVNHELVMRNLIEITDRYKNVLPERMSHQEIEDRLKNFKFRED